MPYTKSIKFLFIQLLYYALYAETFKYYFQRKWDLLAINCTLYVLHYTFDLDVVFDDVFLRSLWQDLCGISLSGVCQSR